MIRQPTHMPVIARMTPGHRFVDRRRPEIDRSRPGARIEPPAPCPPRAGPIAVLDMMPSVGAVGRARALAAGSYRQEVTALAGGEADAARPDRS